MKISSAVIAVSCFVALPAWGAGSVDAGRTTFSQSNCQVCHGAATGSFFDVARFKAEVLTAAFQSNAAMSSFLALGAQAINDIAAYLGVPDGNDTDRLLDWGEDTYPQLLSPTRQKTGELLGYSYRYYPDTGIYVGTKDGKVWFFDSKTPGAEILELGTMRSFLDQMPNNR